MPKQSTEPRLIDGDDGAMLMAGRQTDAMVGRCKVEEIARGYCSETAFTVGIVIDEILLAHLDDTRPFGIGGGKTGGRMVKRSVRRMTEHTEKVAEARFAVVFKNENIVAGGSFHKKSINAVKPRVVIRLHLGKCAKVFSGEIVHSLGIVDAQRIGSRVAAARQGR